MDSHELAAIASRHGIRLLLQFGSTVGGSTHPRSDLDLAVLLDEPVDVLHAYSELAADLQRLAPGREVDLALLNRADPLFMKQIVQRCTRLYGSEAELDRLKLYAWKRYVDHRRFLDMEWAYVDRQVKSLAR